jgi:hypothetical protein
MLGNVMPQRGAFFNLLAAHTDRLVAGASATLRLISGLGNPAAQSALLIEEVNVNETSADRIKAEFIKLLYEAFTTPVSRDQLHTLILDLDRVLDTLQSAANAITMYNIADSTPAARVLASLGSDACLRLNHAVIALADRNGGAVIVAQCRDIDALEARASTTMREAVTELFLHEGDEQAAWHAVKMRRFYFTQAAVLDQCRRAAKTIDEILLENA